MNWRGRLRKSFIFLTLGMFTTLSLLLPLTIPNTAQATGAPGFNLSTDPILRRISENTMTIKTRLSIFEKGIGAGIGNETFAFFTLKQTLTLVPDNDNLHDEWEVTKVEISNLATEKSYGTSYSVLESPRFVTFINRSKEVVAIVGYNGLPYEEIKLGALDSGVNIDKYLIPCYRVSLRTSGYANPSLRTAYPIKGRASGGCNAGSDLDLTNDSPVETIASRIDFQSNLSENSQAIVLNYDLSSTGPEPEVIVNRSTVKAWFKGFRDYKLSIKRLETKGKAPYIYINAKSSRGNRPELRFVLSHIAGEGAFAFENIDWFIFEAHTVDSDGNEKDKIDNLYLLLNDNFGEKNINVIFSTNSAEVKKGQFDPDEELYDGDVISSSTLKDFYGRVYSRVPQDGNINNCSGVKVYTVGPTGGDDVRHYDEISGRDNKSAGLLNGNCIVPGSGWPLFWGVGVKSIPFEKSGDSSCSPTWIVDGGLLGVGLEGKNEPPAILVDLGIDENDLNVFSRATLCIYIWTVIPLTEWVTGLIADAAGVAMLPERIHIKNA